MLKRVRNYAVEEQSFTCSFAAWDLSRTGEQVSVTPVKWAVEELVRLGVIRLIEDNGRHGKVYAYVPPPKETVTRTNFPELDASRLLGVGALAPVRGVEVAHVRPKGPSGRPGRDRKRQANGVQIKRARQGT
jgi:hypothetical protein